MLTWFLRSLTTALVSLCVAGLAFAQPAKLSVEDTALLEEFLTVEIAQVQAKGEVQISLSYAAEEADDNLATSGLGELEIEYGLTSRLQIAVEVPLNQGLAVGQNDVALALGYRLFSAGRRTNLVAAAGSSAHDASGLHASLIGGTAVGSGEIHSALTFNREDHNSVLEVAAVYPLGRWRALLEAAAESHDSARQITPGMAWQNDFFGFGAGVTFRRGELPGLVLKATVEF